MSTENPYLAGLASVSRFTAPAAITPYTLGKVSAANTLAIMGTADADTKVAGVWLSGRSDGDNQGVPFCTVRGVLLPMLSDGAGALAAGDNVSASTTTAGRVKLSTGAGIGIVLAGAPATADALVVVLFTGSGGSGSSAASTLAASYAAGASQTDSTLALDATRLGMRVRDNASPVSGGIFQVQNSDGTTTYFNVNSAGTISVKSGYADGVTAAAFLIDSVTAWGNGSARLLTIKTGGSEKAWFDVYGDLIIPTAGSGIFASTAYSTGLTLDASGGFLNLSAANAIRPGTDLTPSLGTSARRWTSLWARSKYGVQQNVTSSGAVVIAPDSGEVYKLTSNGNVTSLSINTGTFDGQVIQLVLTQNAAGTDTWPTVIGNASLAGGAIAKTLTANAIDVFTFVYDSASTKWREVSRSQNQS